MKHTPGPWIAKEEFVLEDDGMDDGVVICKCNTDPYWGKGADAFVNAHFIAAAPDLLEACKLVVEHYSKDKYEPAIIACKQAIAKATSGN